MGPCLEAWETEGPGSCREKRPAGLQCRLGPVDCVASGFGPCLQELTMISSDVKRVCQIPWELKRSTWNFKQKPIVYVRFCLWLCGGCLTVQNEQNCVHLGSEPPLGLSCVCRGGGVYMTPFRGRVACVSFLVEAIFLDEFSPQALCPVGEKLMQAQVPQARAGLECSLSLPIGWGGGGQVQIYISGVSVDLRNRTKQEAEMPAMP